MRKVYRCEHTVPPVWWFTFADRNALGQWDGTIFGASLKNMYENGTSYEGICEYADIDYKDYEEE